MQIEQDDGGKGMPKNSFLLRFLGPTQDTPPLRIRAGLPGATCHRPAGAQRSQSPAPADCAAGSRTCHLEVPAQTSRPLGWCRRKKSLPLDPRFEAQRRKSFWKDRGGKAVHMACPLGVKVGRGRLREREGDRRRRRSEKGKVGSGTPTRG